jgi:hypothetical protein
MVCAKCLVALDWNDNTGWVHPIAHVRQTSGVAGHNPQPVAAENMPEHRYVCDFCFEPDPTWHYDCDDFILLDDERGTFNSHAAWAACDACHDAIENNDRDLLVNRAMHGKSNEIQRIPTNMRDQFALQLHIVYRQFFEGRRGPATTTIR